MFRVVIGFMLLTIACVTHAEWRLECEKPIATSPIRIATLKVRQVRPYLHNVVYWICRDTGGSDCVKPRFADSLDFTESVIFVRETTKMCYQHIVKGRCATGVSEVKPTPPYACVWDFLTTAERVQLYNLGLIP